MITSDAITAFIRQLDGEATCSSTGNEWIFANGESVFRCTTSARRVAEAFGGCVVGFTRDDNPTAEILDGEDGHDFAFIADRFVVDYWAAFAAGVIDRPVFDLLAASDRATVLQLYGPNDAWKPVSLKNVRSPHE
jgi:hypothetical protein